MIAILDPQRLRDAATEEVRLAVDAGRRAQLAWAQESPRERARIIGKIRPLLARHATSLARVTAAVWARPIAEKLTSEILPLVEAARFLQKQAPRILRPRRHAGRGRPLWLHGHSFTVERKPWGLVLIVGPANYPLFLPAVQALHAIAAGNAVLIKPAPSCTEPIEYFVDQILPAAGVPKALVQILPEASEAAHEAIRGGIDKAIFTGSSENGRDFLAALAEQNIPSVMELSGADVVYVRADADLERTAKAIAFGLRLNAGETCMAPHTIVAHASVAAALSIHLRERGISSDRLRVARDDAHALEIAAQQDSGLGAAIFSRDEAAAQRFARQLQTGFVTINDLIVPTADPRFPFGGTRGSGFGVTRGAEGLLEMTFPHAIAIRRSRFLPHLDPPAAGDAELFQAFIESVHGQGLWSRLKCIGKLARLIRQRKQP